jgi:hypothetical protein
MTDATTPQPPTMTDAIRFGDKVLNTSAGESNPKRISTFVRWVYDGKNRDKLAECTDGNGNFWRIYAKSIQKHEDGNA